MKIKMVEKEAGLSLKTLRGLEQEYGVYFVQPKNRSECPCQQFGVYDEDEVYVGDIESPERWFTPFSIEGALIRLFNSTVGHYEVVPKSNLEGLFCGEINGNNDEINGNNDEINGNDDEMIDEQ